MFDFNSFVLKRINSIAEKAAKIEELMKPLEMETDRTSVYIDFYIMDISKDGTALIPVGTADRPTGISLLKDSYILFLYNKKPAVIAHSDELKQYIKINFENLDKDHSEEYRLAVRVGIKNLIDAKMAMKL